MSVHGPERLVVVGNGMAGARAVEEIVARAPGMFDIHVFGDEPYGNYNRILLSNLLAEGRDPDEDIFLNPVHWYDKHGVALHAGVRIVRIDRFAKLVYGDNGAITRYDKLILATGSRPFFPPTEGLWADDRTLTPGVFGFRTLDDTTSMLRHARDHRRAVVIGGGLLGLEAARGLQSHGLEVEVVQSAPVLMNQQLDERGGRILRGSLQRLGINIRTGVRITAVLRGDDHTLETSPAARGENARRIASGSAGGGGVVAGGAAGSRGGTGRVIGVRLGDGATLDCDMVVVTAGIRPNVGLGAGAGLTVHRAIVVDDQMRSVDEEDIYVVGECAQHRGEVYGLVAPLWEQAAVLADHITGRDPHAAYHGSRLATRLKVAGVDVVTMGLKEPEREDDEFIQFAEPSRGIYKTVVIRDGTLVGATLLGDTSRAAFLTQAFGRRAPLPEDRLRLLFELGGPAEETAAAELDDDVQVCNCNGVGKGQIVSCVRGGVKSLGGVMAATRAGKGCGSCKSLVADIVKVAADGEVEEDPDYYVPCIPLAKPALMTEIRARGLRSVSAVFAGLSPDGREHAPSKMPLASLLRMMWGREYVDERDARFINDRVHANIQKDGTFSVVPQIKGGVTTPAQLRRIAEVAERYGVPMVKITGGQRIDLLGVRKEDLPKVWAELDMPSGYAYGKSFRTVKTCVGSDFCRYGLGDSTALGIAIEDRYKGLESPAKLKLAVAGCPRNCSEALVKDLGVVAVEGGRWEIYVGGAAGAHVRKGDLLMTVDTPEEVIRFTGRFLQYYRENARWLERTYDFVPRVGVDHIREVITDESESARLDAAMDESIAAYSDPWKEHGAPVTEGQFRPSLPLIELPRVPTR